MLSNGVIVEFAANERWIENYATAKKDTQAPNSMWKRRPYAQLAKCAEAQALRKAFPEIGSAPTAEEMEGKEFETASYQSVTQQEQKVISYYPTDRFEHNFSGWKDKILNGGKTASELIEFIESRGSKMTEEQKTKINEIKKEV
jgi:hypothetical protein